VVRLARRVVRRLIRRLGFDLVRRSSSNAPHALRQAILDREAISAVIDGGAFVGWYARELRGTGYRGRIASFEPLREPFAQLQRAAEADERWEVHRLGLGAEDGQRVLNVAGNLMSSSLLPMLELHAAAAAGSAYVGTEPIDLVRLDSLAPTILAPDDRVYLKLDVQGTELDALDGARTSLPRVRAMELELSVVPLYEGAPLLAEMLGRIDEMGFDLVSIAPAWIDPRTGHVLQLNAIFLRRS